MNTISLKSIKTDHRASQETICYSAVVYVDNKKAGVVSNDGRGGCSVVMFLDQKYQPLLEQKFEIECFCDGLNHKCKACKGTGKYMGPIDEYLDDLRSKAELESEIAKLKKKGNDVALITSSSVYGVKTPVKDEQAIRMQLAKKIKEVIKEVRFL